MMKNWLSRYGPRYPRSLVYMLQASEYNIRDYFSWHCQVDDFRNVERRKTLVKTSKTILLLAVAWCILLVLYGAGIFVLLMGDGPFRYFVSLPVLFFAPDILAYAITVPLFAGKIFIQFPLEYFIIKKARQKLAGHKGLKIAIAGSFGKTSMREILRTVLSVGKKVSAPPHSYNTLLSISRFVSNLKGDEEVLIFEFGEYYPGDIRKLCELVRPQMGIITGVNEAHLEKFKNLDKTVNTIFELAECLGEAPLYVNGENKLAKEKASVKDIVYSREGVGIWKVEEPVTGLDGTSFVLAGNGQKFNLRTKLLGLHQIGPLVAAFDIAVRLGLSQEKIQKGIENTKPFEHRLEPKVDVSGVITLDDSYNGNPDGVKAVIDFLASLKGHRRFYVTPGLVEMGPRTEAVHKEIGRSLAKAEIEKVILIKNSVTSYIEEGLKEAGYNGEVIRFSDALSAFAALPHLTIKGDIVLLQNDWPDQYR